LANATGSTVIFDGGAMQTVRPNGQTFDTVSVAGSDVRWTGSSTVGNLSIGAGKKLTLDSSVERDAVTLNVTGGKTLTNSGTLALDSSDGSLILKGSGGVFSFSGTGLSLGTNSLVVGDISYSPNLTISTAGTLSLDGDATFTALTLDNAGATFAIGTHVLNTGAVTLTSGTLSVAGPTGQLNSGGAAVNINGGDLAFITANGASANVGDFSVSSGTVTNGFTNTITASGNLSVGGTFSSPTNSTFVVTGVSSTIGATTTLGNLQVGSTATSATLSSNLTLDGELTVTGGILTIPVATTLTVGSLVNSATIASSGSLSSGDFTSTGTLTNPASNTITATGNVEVSNTVSNPTNLTLTMNVTKTLTASVPLGHLTIGSTNTVTLTTSALTLGGDLLVSSGTLNLGGWALTLEGSQLQGTVVNLSSGTSPTVTASQAVELTGPTSITTWTSSGGGSVSFAALDGAQTLTLSAGTGTVTLNGEVGGTTPLTSLSLSSTNASVAALSVGNVTTTGNQTYSGNVTLSASSTFTTSSGVISLTAALNGSAATNDATFALGAGSASVTGPLGTTTNLRNLTVNSGALTLGNNNVSLAGNLSSTGTVNASAITGTFDVAGEVTSLAALSAPGGTLTVGGNWEVTSLTASTSTSTVRFTSASPRLRQGTGSFANLTLDQGGTLATSANVAGNFQAANTGTGGTLDLATFTLGVAGNLNLNPLASTGATLVSGTSTLNLNGSGAQSVTSNGQSWATVITATRGAGTVTFTDALNATTLTVSGAGAYGINLTSGGTTTSAVTFANTGGVTIGAGYLFTGGVTSTTVGTNTFTGSLATGGGAGQNLSLSNLTLGGNLSFNAGSGGTINVSGAVTGASNSLTVTNSNGTTFSSTLSAATLAITNSTGSISVAGNLTLTTGLTLAAGTYNVSLTGTTNAIAGATTFNNTGTLTVAGTSTQFTAGVTATAPVLNRWQEPSRRQELVCSILMGMRFPRLPIRSLGALRPAQSQWRQPPWLPPRP